MVKRSEYITKNIGDFPDTINVAGRRYLKKDDLRYGDNPHQAAVLYVPEVRNFLVVGDYEELKTGKEGLSRTNVFDMDNSLNILKYPNKPACAVMKHLNTCGTALMKSAIRETPKDIYVDARDGDPIAAFGAVVTFNYPVDTDTAEEIMTTFIECVVAPEYDEGVMDIFNRTKKAGRGLNQEIRIVKVGNLGRLAKYVGDDIGDYMEVAYLTDGSIVAQEPYLSKVRSSNDFEIRTTRAPNYEENMDMEFLWRIAAHTRSNAVVIGRDARTYGVGTGRQDRLASTKDSIEIAVRSSILKDFDEGIERLKDMLHDDDITPENVIFKFALGSMTGKINLQEEARKSGFKDLSLASDGFFPQPDAFELANEFYVSSVVQPGGSRKDKAVIAAANERGVAMVFSPERVFAHF